MEIKTLLGRMGESEEESRWKEAAESAEQKRMEAELHLQQTLKCAEDLKT